MIMTRRIGSSVSQKLSRAHAQDPVRRLKDDCDHLARHSMLRFELEIPHAAAAITVVADVEKRTVSCTMRIAAPKDKKRATARVNWLLRQLAGSDPEDIYIKALWPGRTQPTQASLRSIRNDADALLAGGSDGGPQGFEVILVRDLAGKFSGAKTFIEQLEATLPHYYEEVGQHLRAWVPPPPKLKEGTDVLGQTTVPEGGGAPEEASETKSDGGITTENNSELHEAAGIQKSDLAVGEKGPDLAEATGAVDLASEAKMERDEDGGSSSIPRFLKRS